jgi:hypothetical protein
MADERTHHTAIDICGLDCRLEVVYNITSYGTSDSWEEPGDPPECEIVSVTDPDTGRDLYDYCARTIPADKLKVQAEYGGYSNDRMLAAVVGVVNPYYDPTGEYANRFPDAPKPKPCYHYLTKLRVTGETVLDMLYDEIYSDGDSFVYDEPCDYDPRDD